MIALVWWRRRNPLRLPSPPVDRRVAAFGNDRPRLVIEARRAIARGSKSFALASRLFDRQTRERAWLLYGWCRHCDDLIDGQTGGGTMRAVVDPQRRLAVARELTRRAMRGERTGHPAFDALGVVAIEAGLPREWPDELLAGFALDAAGFQPQDEDALMRYCWHVAGAVGVMMAVVMGVPAADRATLRRAADLGLAFQLNNIARDLVEDHGVGRCYLPATWLAEEGLSASDYGAPEHRPALARLSARLVALAEAHEASALHGVPMLDRRAAAAVIAAQRIYGGIGRVVVRRGEQAWDRRVTTSIAAKIGHAVMGQLLALVRARRWRPPGPERAGLWTTTAF